MIKLSVNIELVDFEGAAFIDRIDRVADAGYEAFEFWVWTGKDLSSILERKRARDLEMSMITCSSPSSPMLEDMSQGCLTNPRNRSRFLRAIQETIEVAHMLDCPSIGVVTGNALPHLSRETQWASVVAGLQEAGPVAAAGGVTLVVEPLNTLVDHPGYFFSTSDDAFALMREVGHPNVKLLFDIYHQQVTEGNVTQNLTENIAEVGHIHVADCPGRHQPGTGELDYRNIFRAIDRVGYQGHVALEYSPLGDTETSLATIRAMLP